MRYSLLNYLACPYCHDDLVCLTTLERPAPISPAVLSACARVTPAGAVVGPMPAAPPDRELARAVAGHASTAASPGRDFEVEVENGLLICLSCDRWFPIAGLIPELLPDHLRDAGRDDRFLREIETSIPSDVFTQLSRGGAAAVSDDGAHYKRAEIDITTRVSDPLFFGPGYTSPFNLWDPAFTMHLVQAFAAAVPLLHLERGRAVLDSGSGYSWTSEWLYRSGLETIGIDITRIYLEIAVARMPGNRPHLVLADVERLPIRTSSVHNVLAFESFHHLPNRPQAMSEYARVLDASGRVVLYEPDADHEFADVSIETMKRHGILEKGMDWEDVAGYIRATPLERLEEYFAVRFSGDHVGSTLNKAFVAERSMVPGRLFVIDKARPEPRLLFRRGAALVRRARSLARRLLRRASA